MAFFRRPKVNPILTAIAAELNGMKGNWQVVGDRVRGHASVNVSLEEPESNESFHLHPAFWLDSMNPTAPVFRDCVVAPDRDPLSAVRLWSQTTAATVLELMNGRSRFADHIEAGAVDGWPDRHLVCGPVTGWGLGDAPDVLQQWHATHPPVPALFPALSGKIGPNGSGIKIFYGSQRHQPTIEVRIDGVRDQAAADLLMALDWPRSKEPGYMRMYFIAH